MKTIAYINGLFHDILIFQVSPVDSYEEMGTFSLDNWFPWNELLCSLGLTLNQVCGDCVFVNVELTPTLNCLITDKRRLPRPVKQDECRNPRVIRDWT